MDPAVEALIDDGWAALRRGDVVAARTAFDAAAEHEACGASLEGLAEVLHLTEDYGRASRDMYERAYKAYRDERDALGA